MGMGTVSDNYHLALVKGAYYDHRRVPTHLVEKAGDVAPNFIQP